MSEAPTCATEGLPPTEGHCDECDQIAAELREIMKRALCDHDSVTEGHCDDCGKTLDAGGTA